MVWRLASLVGVVVAAAVLGGSAGSGVPCGAEVLNFAPVFSPDSGRVAFLSGGGGGCLPRGKLFVGGTVDATPQLVDGGSDGAPTWAPDGGLFAFERHEALGGPARIAVAAPDGTGFRTLADGQGPSWSADSRELAFFRQDGVYTIGVGGGTPTRIGDGSSPAWSPDGSVAVIDHGVVLIQAPGSTRLLSTLEPRPPLLWSPSGDLLAFAGLTDGAVYVYSFTGPTLRFFPRTFGVPMAWSDDEHELFLRGGDSFFSGVPGVRRFPLGEDVEAISADRGHVAVGVVAGRFGYAGSDLYVADGDGLHSHLVSPPRCASPSPHCLEGTDGADKLVGTAQYDIVFGRAGDDEIYGLAGPNHLEGAFGRDLLVGGPKNDVIDGQLGNDHLIGGAGIDYLDGGPGDDLIETGRGTDYVGGGPGNDRILAADGWRDGIDCGPGNDTVVTDPADHLELCEHVRRRKPAK